MEMKCLMANGVDGMLKKYIQNQVQEAKVHTTQIHELFSWELEVVISQISQKSSAPTLMTSLIYTYITATLIS